MPCRQLAPVHWLAISLVLMAALLTVPALAADRRSSPPALVGEIVDDSRVEAELRAAGIKLMAGKQFVSMINLVTQLRRGRCRLALPRPAAAPVSPPGFASLRPGVLVVASLYKCDSCDDWHLTAAASRRCRFATPFRSARASS